MSDYNGWKNYPTWCVNLWLSNDEGLYNETRTLCAEARDDVDETDPTFTVQENWRANVVQRLKDWVTNELAPDLGATFAADLLGYALGEVDWYELADAWLSDMVPA